MTAAIAMLDERHEGYPRREPHDDNNYELGSISGHNIIIACLPHGNIGTTSAAAVAMKMITTFPSVRVVLMVGIGGGVSKKVRLGDVVVGSPDGNLPGVVQWDMGKAVSGGKFTRTGSLNKTPASLRTTISKLVAHHDGGESKVLQYLEAMLKHPGRGKFQRPEQTPDVLFKSSNPHKDAPDDPVEDDNEEIVDSDDMDQDECRYCDRTRVVNRRPAERPMKVHYGVVASGSKVIKDPIVRDEIYNNLDQKALCVEMEAAGLMDDFPCLVIRGICDYADSHKNSVWQGHAAAAAAAFAKEFLSYLPPSEVEGEKSAKEVLQGLQELQHEVSNINAARITWETGKVLEWLTNSNFGDKQSDCLRKRQDGTGKWFLDSSEYQEWLATPSQILLCSGMPGAGKTIIASIVIEHLESQSAGSDKGLCYAFCDFNKRDDQTFERLMLSLLKQLVKCKQSLPKAVEALYNLHTQRDTRPQIKEIMETFCTLASGFSRVFVIIDALDEYNAGHESQKDFVSRLLAMQKETGISLFATSRPVAQVVDGFSGHLCATMDGNEDDISHYLRNNVRKVLSFKAKNDALMDEVAARISQASKGMFLLATLQLHSLEGTFRERDIHAALADVSNTSQSPTTLYKKVYAITMDRICGQDDYRKKWALQTLGWLTYNKRPLKIVELQHALDMEHGRTSLGPEGDMFSVEYLSSICAGLVTVDNEYGVIRLVHYTTQEYLQSSTEQWFPTIQSTITTSCVTYLSLPHEDYSSEYIKQYCPFYAYALEKWVDHARQIAVWEEPVIRQTVVSFLKYGKLKAWSPITAKGTPTTGLHLAASLGNEDILLEVIDRFNINHIDDFTWKSPLSYAIQEPHLPVVRLLIQRGAVAHYSTLRTAIERDDADLLRLLLNGHQDLGNFTILSMLDWSINYGGSEVMDFLISHYCIDVSRSDLGLHYGKTALHDAIELGKLWAAQTLLKNGATVEDHDRNVKRTPLHYACLSISREMMNDSTASEMVKFLIRCGANVNAADYKGDTPLIIASRVFSTLMVRDLLEAGANVESRNRQGETPLTASFGHYSMSLAEILLEAGANVNAANSKGETPLLKALQEPREVQALQVVKFLLEKGANVHAADNDGETATSIARRRGWNMVLECLAVYQKKRKRGSEDYLTENC
ncbi:hypothetical protein PG984_011781 [Apiospora sp. TS-2023a]